MARKKKVEGVKNGYPIDWQGVVTGIIVFAIVGFMMYQMTEMKADGYFEAVADCVTNTTHNNPLPLAKVLRNCSMVIVT